MGCRDGPFGKVVGCCIGAGEESHPPPASFSLDVVALRGTARFEHSRIECLNAYLEKRKPVWKNK